MDTAFKDKKYVFISYSSKEAEVAIKVCSYLEHNGISCWIAPRNVDPGSNYPSQIVSAIKRCEMLVLLASENTNASGHVSNEVSIAFDNKKIIIPFKLQNLNFTDEYLYFSRQKTLDRRIQRSERSFDITQRYHSFSFRQSSRRRHFRQLSQ